MEYMVIGIIISVSGSWPYEREDTENGTVMMAEWHRKCHSPHHLTATDPWMVISLWFWSLTLLLFLFFFLVFLP